MPSCTQNLAHHIRTVQSFTWTRGLRAAGPLRWPVMKSEWPGKVGATGVLHLQLVDKDPARHDLYELWNHEGGRSQSMER